MGSPNKGKRLKKRGRRIQKKRRVCLGCDEQFMSQGPFNRLCDICSARSDYFSLTYDLRDIVGRVKKTKQ